MKLFMLLSLMFSSMVHAKSPLSIPKLKPTTPVERIERIERMLETLVRDRDQQVAFEACSMSCQRANPWKDKESKETTDTRARCYDACPVPDVGVQQ